MPDDARRWFAEQADPLRLERAGFRLGGGGIHLSKTMMLQELSAFLRNAKPGTSADKIVLEDNILDKETISARKITLARLKSLYSLDQPTPLARVLFGLWQRADVSARPLLALLASLAREPLLRDGADAVLSAPRGAVVRWPEIATALASQHPKRFGDKMMKSLAQNCASSWTQSGHLVGKVRKIRGSATATPSAAAYAAWLATLAGFGGPALFNSEWFRVLDRPTEECSALLRQAEALGLVRVRSAGEVFELSVRRPMEETIGYPELADL